MALSALSLMVYNVEVTTLNQNLDFKISGGGSPLTAVLELGFYSPQGLADQIATAMGNADPSNGYSVTVNRNILGGTQNRFTIATAGTFLSLLFNTGPNAVTSCASLVGFNPTDYTGSTSYTGSSTVGNTLIPQQLGYNYVDKMDGSKVFGAVNVSASGLKESVTFNFQNFIEINFKYEPKSRMLEWRNFFLWAIQQRPFDFTPEISLPDTYYQVTLEQTEYEGKGLGYRMKEMLPNFPNFYETGKLKFRVIDTSNQFL